MESPTLRHASDFLRTRRVVFGIVLASLWAVPHLEQVHGMPRVVTAQHTFALPFAWSLK